MMDGGTSAAERVRPARAAGACGSRAGAGADADTDADKKASGPAGKACGGWSACDRREACSPLATALWLCVACALALYVARLRPMQQPPSGGGAMRRAASPKRSRWARAARSQRRWFSRRPRSPDSTTAGPVTIALMARSAMTGPVECDVLCEATYAHRPAAHVRQVDLLLRTSEAQGGGFARPIATARLGGLQLRALSSMESAGSYAALEPSSLRALGFVSLTTNRRSDVPVTYLRRASVVSWGSRPPAWNATRLAALGELAPLISMVASNCGARTGRATLFRQLRKALGGRADSLGRCGNTAAWPTCGRGVRCSKHGALRRYPFHFSAENSAVPDYVTEKAFDALEAGVVPVYLGAPNGAEFLPPGSALFVPSRPNASVAVELAAALRALVASPARYAELLAWRGRPLPAAYARRWAPFVGASARCRLCRFAYAARHEATGNVSWSHAEQQLVLPPEPQAAS